ncbi:MAG: threonine synthase [Planctomycetota bacterium]
MSEFLTHLTCTHCGQTFEARPAEHPWMTCDTCGPEDGILSLHYDLDAVQIAWQEAPLAGRARNHWRYAELLPLAAESVPRSWSVGWTPLIETPRLAQAVGVRQLWCKDEGRNPTASFKDRASSVGVAHARQSRKQTIACASTGNAATSLAGHAALAGMPAVIFVPSTAPEPKLAQLLVYGARVVAVEGSYDAAYQLCTAACEQFGWYNRNCAMNPILVEGKKTGGLEMAEQFANLDFIPDWVSVSVGDGCTITGIWKGLQEMLVLGVITHLPRLLGVQAEQVAPIKVAQRDGQLPKLEGSTIADSINVPVPRNWRRALQAIEASQGAIVTVTDAQIQAAMRDAGASGVFAEPAAAAAVAGLQPAIEAGEIHRDDTVVALITGSGLKDTQNAIAAAGQPIRIPPDLEALKQSL